MLRRRESQSGGVGARGLVLRESLGAVPGQPLLGVACDGLAVALHGHEVVERVGGAQLCGVDQAHEDVANVGAVLGLVEQRVLAVHDGPLQRPFT